MRPALKWIVLTVLLSGQLLLSQTSDVPDISFESTPNLLKLPEHLYLGEVAGVATNSKGHIFVYTRTGSTNATLGGSRIFTHGGSRLFEFDQAGNFVQEWGKNLYAFDFAAAVRIDSQDNVWVVDEAANCVIKFDSQGRFVLLLGRKPESINIGGGGEGGGRNGPSTGAGLPGDNFNMPTDVALDTAGNIYVADGIGNARIAKFDKDGKFLTSWGQRGSEPGQFKTIRSIALDSEGNVYVADSGNNRIQVFDSSGTFKAAYTNVGTPAAICISPGQHQYLYSSNSNSPTDMENGEIYKMELGGQIVGKFGRAGKLLKEFGTVNEIDCRNPNELYVGEITNWRVQRLTLHSAQHK